ncbi:Tn3 family transposase, partial [Klebsiella michiganensis]
SFEQQRYRASGLNLVTAAIVLWNTVYLERATQGLVEAGKPVEGPAWKTEYPTLSLFFIQTAIY